MNDRPINIAASIHARLANEAKNLRRPFGEVLQYYGIERFLYRLSKTQYAYSFILKGGLVFYCWNIPLRRPTKDIDFLGVLPGLFDNRKEFIQQVITASISISAPEDGVYFDPATLVVEEIQVDADRRGIRAKYLGYLSRAQIPMQIDFGFSDEITSEAEIISYPTLLHDLAGSKLRGYPVESVVAEKFHAIERFADVPSRWKDYYDIWLISEHFELDDQSLQKAIAKTFEKRVTLIPAGRPISLTADRASKYRENWKTFLKKYGLENAEINDLLLMVEKIWVFLEWPLQGLVTPKTQGYRRHWIPVKRKWT
jgi:predicted nucleotidyltransferase component of viral defense system